MKKNVASQIIGAQLVSATDGSAFTGSVSVAVTGDGGTQAAGAGTAPAHEGNGFHSYSPTQAETNYDHIAFTFTGTGAVPVTVQVYPSFPQSQDNLTAAEVNAEVDTAISDAALATAANLATVDANVDAVLVDTGTSIPALIAALNDLSAAAVNAEVDTALADIHLDHLLAVNYDPASKPGVATALLNEIIEDDSGVSRFTVNALEQGPSGSGASAAAIADAVWAEPLADHSGGAGSTAEALDGAGGGGGGLDAAGVRAALGMASANLDTQLATIDSLIDAILVDTGTDIPATLALLATAASLTTVDTVVDAIKVKTDSLNFGVTGKVDANVTHINETEVTGNGSSATPWGPA